MNIEHIYKIYFIYTITLWHWNIQHKYPTQITGNIVWCCINTKIPSGTGTLTVFAQLSWFVLGYSTITLVFCANGTGSSGSMLPKLINIISLQVSTKFKYKYEYMLYKYKYKYYWIKYLMNQ